MGLNNLVGFAQEHFGQDRPPPDGRFPVPPSWVPVNVVEALQSGSLAAENVTDNPNSPLAQVQILHPGDTIGVGDGLDSEEDPTQSESLQTDRYGTDALAYYLPFHFYRSAWGVYLRESGLKSLTNVLKGEDNDSPDSAYVNLAYQVLYEHEMFHHLCELVASFGELAWLDDMYSAYFSDKSAAEKEEAMANAYAFRTRVSSRLRDARARLRSWMTTQGAGYRDFGKYGTIKAFQGGQSQISERIFKALSSNATKVIHQTHYAFNLPATWPGQALFEAVASQKPRKFLRDRTYLVMDCSPPWLSVFKPFPDFNGVRVEVYSRDHKPPHFHIFIPSDRPKYLTRYTWPQMQPYNGDYTLSHKERRRLDQYLQRYGTAIAKKIQQVPWL
jgi:hypothetical protein